MALNDIVGQSGDGQDFIVEIPAGNAGYVPSDALVETNGMLMSSDIPLVVEGEGGGNIFIMSE